MKGLTHVVGTLLRLLVGGHLYALKYKTSNVLIVIERCAPAGVDRERREAARLKPNPQKCAGGFGEIHYSGPWTDRLQSADYLIYHVTFTVVESG